MTGKERNPKKQKSRNPGKQSDKQKYRSPKEQNPRPGRNHETITLKANGGQNRKSKKPVTEKPQKQNVTRTTAEKGKKQG